MAEGGTAREDEAQDATDHPSRDQTGKQDGSDAVEPKEELCPITDKDEKPFRLMDLPPEIRIEIYRACLTRPFDILLSREPKPPEKEKGKRRARDVDEDDDEDEYEDEDEEEEDDDDDGEHITFQELSGGHGTPATLAFHSDRADTANANSATTWSARGMRALRSFTRNNLQRAADANRTANGLTNNTLAGPATRSTTRTINPDSTNFRSRSPVPRGRRAEFIASSTIGTSRSPAPRAPRPQDVDPLLVNLLRTSKLIYKEARAILYGENNFLLDLDTAQPTLAALHQRSRGQIKHLRVTIPTHNEILERFAEVVRLSLRYCWRLQRFVIHTPFVLPGAEGSTTSGNTTVYANAFDILRWLPRQCEVVLEGNVCEEIRRVVEKNSNLAKSLDEVSFSRYELRGMRRSGLGKGA